MGIKKYILVFLIFLLAIEGLYAQPKFTNKDYIKALKQVTDIMVNDVTSPVAASRYYAYITIASYETMAAFSNTQYISFDGTIYGFHISKPKELTDSFNTSLSSVLSVYLAGKLFLPSGSSLQLSIDSLELKYKKIDPKIYEKSLQLANAMVDQVFAYSKKDGFNKLSGMQKYTPKNGLGNWQPTPPVFMAPVEPNWGKLKTFLLDSSTQFKVQPPVAYSDNKNSTFYALTKEVYLFKKNATIQQQAIANFWDCNPFAVEQIGHVEFGLKKISPGGHWLGIAGIACRQQNLSFSNTVLVHALTSITLADAFIACWQEKYSSDRIRPVTVIQRFFDAKWAPLLQTPPFPEYVSGHSVASTAAAIVLTKIFGNQLSYTDNTEVEFDIPSKNFKSFNAAATEASISRIYGGIHFRDAIDQGVWLGNQIGLCAITKLNKQLNKAKF